MKKLILIAVLLMFSTILRAQAWIVNDAASQVNFISIKKGDVAEVHRFMHVSGELQANDFSLTIPLSSVNTNIEIRDQRMESMLFEVAKYPELQLHADVQSELVNAMAVGEFMQQKFDAKVTLHGESQTIPVQVIIAKLSEGQLMVTSLQPIIVRADAFKLGEGIEKLRQIASLSSITWVVPVTFVLVLDR